jgi:DNA-directed RNA polymerase specialized sigma24 family protein
MVAAFFLLRVEPASQKQLARRPKFLFPIAGSELSSDKNTLLVIGLKKNCLVRSTSPHNPIGTVSVIAPVPDEPEFHSVEEARAAIQGLTVAQLTRLRRFAQWRMRGVTSRVGYRDDSDLLQEAVTALLNGTRHWKCGVTFCDYVIGCMRSISSAWFESVESAIVWDAGIDTLSGSREAPDRVIDARDEVHRVFRMFGKGSPQERILHGWYLGENGKEIQDNLGISQREYDTLVKGIRRRLHARLRREWRSETPNQAALRS